MSPTKRTAQAILRRSADAIEAEAASLNLHEWGFDEKGDSATYTEGLVAPTCGTPACVAGHIAWQGRRNFKGEVDLFVSDAAQSVLDAIGIEAEAWHIARTDSSYYDLFADSPYLWPEKYRPETPDNVAAAAARMLRDIAEGKHDAFVKTS